MRRGPAGYTRTHPLFPYTSLFRSVAQHVVPAPRGAQIDDQQDGTGCRARGGHCPGGAAHAAIGCAVDALADVGKGLGGTGEPGQKDIATHRPVPGAWLQGWHPIVALAPVGSVGRGTLWQRLLAVLYQRQDRKSTRLNSSH